MGASARWLKVLMRMSRKKKSAAGEEIKDDGAIDPPRSLPEEEEERAAIVIQTFYRALLARRALKALKGLVRLQALVRGHAVRREAAMTMQCMETLVKVQARVRARRVGTTVESRTKGPPLQARAREIEAGWCDASGSVEDIQARLQKRKEAAAKRERALAYAMSRQRQASLRLQRSAEENQVEGDWMERWMAARSHREKARSSPRSRPDQEIE